MVVLDNGHFFVVATKEIGLFVLQKFTVGQMITQGITAIFLELYMSVRAILRPVTGSSPPVFGFFQEKNSSFFVEVPAAVLRNV